MHEMSLAGGILKLVEDAALRERFARVTCLRLEAGRFAGVEVRALRFALESMTPRTCLDGARIDIDEPAGAAWCLACDRSVAVDSLPGVWWIPFAADRRHRVARARDAGARLSEGDEHVCRLRMRYRPGSHGRWSSRPR